MGTNEKPSKVAPTTQRADTSITNKPNDNTMNNKIVNCGIKVFWRDPKEGTEGAETLHIQLSRPLAEVMPAKYFKLQSLLCTFSSGTNHIYRDRRNSQSEARRRACEAAGTLTFADATGLVPTDAKAGRPFVDSKSTEWESSRVDSLPEADHHSGWYLPSQKGYLIADQPYDKAMPAVQEQRAAWAARNGFTIVKPNWPGMYAPDLGTRLYLISRHKGGVLLDPIVEALDRLPAPITVVNWNGESAPIRPYLAARLPLTGVTV